ncbi:MAG TPA: hypothetical protein VMY59_03405 [Candidatus Thermoplasmatota archaeon]|nr:hypothetical protein [Candidatus Thermoplasmatota archaeon]
MNKGIARKSLVFGIIMLFIGTSIIPVSSDNISEEIGFQSRDIIYVVDDM